MNTNKTDDDIKPIMKPLFRNQSKLKSIDIFWQILLGVFIIGLIYILNPIRRPSSSNNPIYFFAFGSIMAIAIAIRAMREQTILQIDFNETTNELIIIVQQQLKGTKTLTFESDHLNIFITNKADRLLPINRIIIIKDNFKAIQLSVRDTGIGKVNFDKILLELKKHYPKRYNNNITTFAIK